MFASRTWQHSAGSTNKIGCRHTAAQCAPVCREILEALIPAMLGAQGGEEEGDDSLLQGITRGSFQGIMQDRLSSHVMEASTLSSPHICHNPILLVTPHLSLPHTTACETLLLLLLLHTHHTALGKSILLPLSVQHFCLHLCSAGVQRRQLSCVDCCHCCLLCV